MDEVAIRQSAVEDFKTDCIKTCNEIQQIVNAWIKQEKSQEKSALYTSNINIADFECIAVDYVMDQEGGDGFLIYCSEGDDLKLAHKIISVAQSKTGCRCNCIIDW